MIFTRLFPLLYIWSLSYYCSHEVAVTRKDKKHNLQLEEKGPLLSEYITKYILNNLSAITHHCILLFYHEVHTTILFHYHVKIFTHTLINMNTKFNISTLFAPKILCKTIYPLKGQTRKNCYSAIQSVISL